MPLTNAQYDEIMRAYEARRTAAQRAAAERRKSAYQSAPQLAALDQEIASASVARAKRCIMEGESSLGDLDRLIACISGQKDEILRGLGMSAADLKPVYDCPLCSDTGYIDGKKCRCLKQAEADYLYARSNLQSVLEEENFQTFSFDYYPADLIDPDSRISSLALAQSAFEKCRRMTREFNRNPVSLFFTGNTGTGKTFLTNCIAKELLDQGYSVIYFSAFELFEILSGRLHHKTDTPEDYDTIFSCDLLIIDDLGTEAPNAFTISRFFHCLNERLLSRKPMLISTNLTLREIAGIYSERISSRITESFIPVKLYGKDIRILKKLQTI